MILLVKCNTNDTKQKTQIFAINFAITQWYQEIILQIKIIKVRTVYYTKILHTLFLLDTSKSGSNHN